MGGIGPYVWNDNKHAANLAAHGIDFTEALRFDWETARFTNDSRRDYGEIRIIAVGKIGPRLHVLVFTRRAASIRLISLRKANTRKRTQERPSVMKKAKPKSKVRFAASDLADVQSPPLTDEQLANMRPSREFPGVLAIVRRFRGSQRRPTKNLISLRLDGDVIEHFRARGPGWQSRINATLRKAVGL